MLVPIKHQVLTKEMFSSFKRKNVKKEKEIKKPLMLFNTSTLSFSDDDNSITSDV